MSDRALHLSTTLVHQGQGSAVRGRGTSPVIDRSSTFCLDGGGDEALASGRGLREHDVYGRYGTSTTRSAAELVSALEGAEAGLLLASGMAAITAVLLTSVPAGGCLALSDEVYGGTSTVVDTLLRDRSVEVVRFDATDPSSLAAAFERRVPDMAWCESISNPLVKVAKIRALAALCRDAGVSLAVDATFTAGLAQRPLALGAHIVVHSATKYLNGHSDVIAGAVCADRARIEAVYRSAIALGGCIDPHAAWLLVRGIRTLPLRFRRQCDTAGRLARALADDVRVGSVHYPGLQPDRARADGPLEDFGGVLSFDLEDGARAKSLVEALGLIMNAPSLGGLETLVSRPRRSSHRALSDEDGQRLGITSGLLRLSIGLEEFDDLWADLDAALTTITRGQ